MSKKMTQEKLNREFTVLRTGLAIGIGVLLSVIIILLVSDEPLLSIQYLVFGPLMSLNNFCSLLTMWIPIVITGLAVCIMFSANQFNLFGEGAFLWWCDCNGGSLVNKFTSRDSSGRVCTCSRSCLRSDRCNSGTDEI